MNAPFVTDRTPPAFSMAAFGDGPYFGNGSHETRLSVEHGDSLWPPRLALLAGGLATRLRPLTSFMPKSLIQVAGEPFLAHQLRLIRAGGIREVVLCCGFLGEQIEDFAGDGSQFGLSITYSHDGPQPLGTGGALRAALPLLGRRFLVMYGDSWLDVIRRTGLEATPDYFAPHPGPFAALHKLFFWRKPLEPLSTPLADAPNRRYVALKIFAHHRKIAPDAGTRLIAIGYSDPDPTRAAAVVNALVQSLSDYGFHSRSSAAAQSAAWLSAQLAGLKQQTETLDVLPFTQSIAGLPLLSVVHAGARPPFPPELIASSRMTGLLAAWRDEFSFIVIHSPAAFFADALVLAQLSDAVLMTARAGETKRDEVLPAYHALSRQVPDHAVLGVILESAPPGVACAHA